MHYPKPRYQAHFSSETTVEEIIFETSEENDLPNFNTFFPSGLALTDNIWYFWNILIKVKESQV